VLRANQGRIYYEKAIFSMLPFDTVAPSTPLLRVPRKNGRNENVSVTEPSASAFEHPKRHTAYEQQSYSLRWTSASLSCLRGYCSNMLQYGVRNCKKGYSVVIALASDLTDRSEASEPTKSWGFVSEVDKNGFSLIRYHRSGKVCIHVWYQLVEHKLKLTTRVAGRTSSRKHIL